MRAIFNPTQEPSAYEPGMGLKKRHKRIGLSNVRIGMLLGIEGPGLAYNGNHACTITGTARRSRNSHYPHDRASRKAVPAPSASPSNDASEVNDVSKINEANKINGVNEVDGLQTRKLFARRLQIGDHGHDSAIVVRGSFEIELGGDR